MNLSAIGATASRSTSAGSATDTARRWLLPGLIAGAVFLAVAMVGGAFTSTPWAMPEAIAATIGLGSPGQPFGPGVVLVGVLVHLTVSMALGALFTAIAYRCQLRGRALVIGAVIYMLVESAVSIWAVLHTMLSSTTFTFFVGAVPWWASVTGRILYGLVLGLLLVAGPMRAEGAQSQ